MEKIILCPFTLKNIINYHKLKKLGRNVVGFFDRNSYLHGAIYENTHIERARYMPDTTVVVCSDNFFNEISKELQSIGYKDANIKSICDFELKDINENEIAKDLNLDDIYHLLGYGDASIYVKAKKLFCLSENNIQIDEFEGQTRKEVYRDQQGNGHIILKRLEVDVTTRCTLRCKNCCNMMQYFSHPNDIDVDVVINDYNRMLELIDWTDDVMPIGGETLLYRNLGKLVEEIYKNPNTSKKVGIVRVPTNGTILPNDEILKEFSKHNLVVEISNYGSKSRKIDELIEKLIRYKIKYIVMNIQWWSNVQQYVPAETIKSEKELLELRKGGCVTLCRVIDQGKFYLCCNLKSLMLLEAIPQDVRRECYIDVYDKNAKNQIVEYLSRNKRMPKACSWCNGCSWENWNNSKIPVAEQTREVLEYKRYGE